MSLGVKILAQHRVGDLVGDIEVVYAASAKPFKTGKESILSGIVKDPLEVIRARPEGVVGDETVYKTHGGPDRAVHFVAVESYDDVAKEIVRRGGDAKLLAEDSGHRVGENVRTRGLDPKQVFLGDEYEIDGSTVRLQVSMPRNPCVKLNAMFGHKDVRDTFLALGVTGWFCRVLREGDIKSGSKLKLVKRLPPHQLQSVWETMRIHNDAEITPSEVEEIGSHPLLAEYWRDKVKIRLRAHNKVPIPEWAVALAEEDRRRHKYVKHPRTASIIPGIDSGNLILLCALVIVLYSGFKLCMAMLADQGTM